MSRRTSTKDEKRARNKYYARVYKQSGEAAAKRKEAMVQQKRDRVCQIERDFCKKVWQFLTDEELEVVLPAVFADVVHKMRDEHGRRPEVMPKIAPPSNDTEAYVPPGATNVKKQNQPYKKPQFNKKVQNTKSSNNNNNKAKPVKKSANGDGGYLRA